MQDRAGDAPDDSTRSLVIVHAPAHPVALDLTNGVRRDHEVGDIDSKPLHDLEAVGPQIDRHPLQADNGGEPATRYHCRERGEHTENLDLLGRDPQLFARLAQCRRDHAGIEGLGAATRERNLSWVLAKLLGAEHEEQRYTGCRRVAQEQHRGRAERIGSGLHDVTRVAHRRAKAIDDRHRGGHAASAPAAQAVEAVRLDR